MSDPTEAVPSRNKESSESSRETPKPRMGTHTSSAGPAYACHAPRQISSRGALQGGFQLVTASSTHVHELSSTSSTNEGEESAQPPDEKVTRRLQSSTTALIWLHTPPIAPCPTHALAVRGFPYKLLDPDPNALNCPLSPPSSVPALLGFVLGAESYSPLLPRHFDFSLHPSIHLYCTLIIVDFASRILGPQH
eukprot:gene10726-7456_t